MGDEVPTTNHELSEWLKHGAEDESLLQARLGMLIEALSSSEDSQKKCCGVLAEHHFAAFGVLVDLFAKTEGGPNLMSLIQLCYVCCMMIPGAPLTFFQHGGFRHCRELVGAAEQDPDIMQGVFLVVKLCLTHENASNLPESDLPDVDTVQTYLSVVSTNNEDLAKEAVLIMVQMHAEFCERAGNIVLDALRHHNSAQDFSTTLVMVLNRLSAQEETTLCLRFFADLFNDADFKDFFFASDLRVMIDIILREMDGEFEEDREILYLFMLVTYGVLRESSYKDTRYRCEDISSMLSRIGSGKLSTERTGLLAKSIASDCATFLCPQD